MNIKSILLQKILPALAVAGTVLALGAGTVSAVKVQDGGGGSFPADSPTSSPLGDSAECTGTAAKCIKQVNKEKCNTQESCNPIRKYVNPFIKVLSGLAGLAIVVGLIWGGIQYSMSEGDPSKVSTAKRHIRNSVLALVAFLFLYAFIRFLAPGQITG